MILYRESYTNITSLLDYSPEQAARGLGEDRATHRTQHAVGVMLYEHGASKECNKITQTLMKDFVNIFYKRHLSLPSSLLPSLYSLSLSLSLIN